ncbi:MAG: hypothetical protein ACKOQS_31320 [Dolichospermum sp.]
MITGFLGVVKGEESLDAGVNARNLRLVGYNSSDEFTISDITVLNKRSQ